MFVYACGIECLGMSVRVWGQFMGVSSLLPALESWGLSSSLAAGTFPHWVIMALLYFVLLVYFPFIYFVWASKMFWVYSYTCSSWVHGPIPTPHGCSCHPPTHICLIGISFPCLTLDNWFISIPQPPLLPSPPFPLLFPAFLSSHLPLRISFLAFFSSFPSASSSCLSSSFLNSSIMVWLQLQVLLSSCVSSGPRMALWAFRQGDCRLL